MSKETLREFVLSLGFEIDKSQERRFNDTVTSMTKAVIGLGAAVSAASVVIVAGVERIARKFEGLFYSSQRVGASIASIKSFAYAAAQLGSSVEEATGSLESFGRKLRENPQGYAGWLQGLGVQVRKGNGELRDSVDKPRTSTDLADALRAIHDFDKWRVMDRRALRAVYGAAHRQALPY